MARKSDSSNPADWIFFAEEDLHAVRRLAESETAYHVCLSKLAEALEKLMKAELIRRGWLLRKIHDLPKLLDELRTRGSDLIEACEPLAESLADAYFVGRYPGFDLEDADWGSLKATLETVADVVGKVKSRIDQVSGS